MNYLEWVNQDVKRSSRYLYTVQRIAALEEKINKKRNRITALENGASTDYGKSMFTFGNFRMASIKPPSFSAILGYDDEPVSEEEEKLEEQLQKLREERRERAEQARNRASEIKDIENEIEILQSSIDGYKEDIIDLLDNPVVSWLKLPQGEWEQELHYRIMDMGWTESWGELDIDDLFFILKELYWTDDVVSSIGLGRFYCSISIRVEENRISVTRKETEHTNSHELCIIRALLTFIDLAWEHFMPKEVEA